MGYQVTLNGKGGYHVRDSETGVHADANGYTEDDGTVVTPDEEVRLICAGMDAKKQADWDAANARPEAQLPPTPLQAPPSIASVARGN